MGKAGRRSVRRPRATAGAVWVGGGSGPDPPEAPRKSPPPPPRGVRPINGRLEDPLPRREPVPTTPLPLPPPPTPPGPRLAARARRSEHEGGSAGGGQARGLDPPTPTAGLGPCSGRHYKESPRVALWRGGGRAVRAALGADAFRRRRPPSAPLLTSRLLRSAVGVGEATAPRTCWLSSASLRSLSGRWTAPFFYSIGLRIPLEPKGLYLPFLYFPPETAPPTRNWFRDLLTQVQRRRGQRLEKFREPKDEAGVLTSD